MSALPGLSLIGTATKRAAILELAPEAERRGFAALACSGTSGLTAMCASICHVTNTILFFTSVQPIYVSQPLETAATAAHLHEVSGGRFRLGLGVSHAPLHKRLGVSAGKPLSDIRDFVEALHSAETSVGAMPPILLAALRDRMLDLAVDIAQGALWANGSFAHTPTQLRHLPTERVAAMQFANMVPTVIDADLDAARAVHRRTLGGYVTLPNYRNYWRAAGFAEEMDAVEAALANRDREASAAAMSDRFVDDCTISGSPTQVRDRLDAWYDIGVMPIAVMSSTTGGQAKAIRELFDAYA